MVQMIVILRPFEKSSRMSKTIKQKDKEDIHQSNIVIDRSAAFVDVIQLKPFVCK